MTGRIAIVGTGPTGLYTFKHLIDSAPAAGIAAITLFERGETAGIGMPYTPETASRSMLANIASIEIPPVVDSYLDWLTTQPADHIRSYGLDPAGLHDRQFTPRLLLGQYFHAQFRQLCDRAAAAGIAVTVHAATDVTDLQRQEDTLWLATDAGRQGPFDQVVLATGHDFPDADEATRSYFPSPWSGLIDTAIPAARVGILGTSLSGIDAAMAVATQHGRFRRDGDALSFDCDDAALKITLMSWTGVLPEADFYCPLPYLPLQVMTDDAIAACAADLRPLDAAYALFAAELAQEDPAYAARIGLDGLTADSFADAYFADRERADPFRWARANLEEVERNKAARVTVPWRYALLRMHEQIETIVPALSEEDRTRFDGGLKSVFVDNYAAVPSESIRRLLALRDAGVLTVLALGEDYDLTRAADHTRIVAQGRTHVFDVFIDARGQRPLDSNDLPFPTLRAAVLAAGQTMPAVNAGFGLTGVAGFGGVTLAALPWLMQDRPFVQGITASAEIGEAIAAAAVPAQPPQGHIAA